MKQKSNTKTIRVDSTGDNLILKIIVGNGHPSLTTLYKDGNKITELQDSAGDYVVGGKQNLIGSDFLVSSAVHDLPETPDRVIVSHKLFDSTGEIASSDFDIPVDDGEVAMCSSQFYFLK